MEYKYVKIEKIVEENEKIRTFYVDRNFIFMPGQFAKIMIPGIDEKPFSYSGRNCFTIEKKGPFTKKLFEIKENDSFHVIGPYGKGFFPISSDKTYCIIGGGCGIAPLRTLLPYAKHAILGGEDKKDILFFDEFQKELGDNLVCTTDNGSFGIKGKVTAADFPDDDLLYAVCGPEKMIKATGDKINRPIQTYVSLERYMKCGGSGLCGQCEIGGKRVCVDGPVFLYSEVKGLVDSERKRRKDGGLEQHL